MGGMYDIYFSLYYKEEELQSMASVELCASQV
jgi:hypothetical protein